MILQSSSAITALSQILFHPPLCPCKSPAAVATHSSGARRRRKSGPGSSYRCVLQRKFKVLACGIPPPDVPEHNFKLELVNSTRKGSSSFIVKGFSDEAVAAQEVPQESSVQMASNFTNFQEDPIVDKLRTQLGVIHPIPSPPINRSIAGLFVFFFFVGVVFDKVWTSRKRRNGENERQGGPWPQVPTSFSLFLEKDLQRKESVEWVNMVLGKLWKVYRAGLENWIIGLLQPVIDNLEKPDYVQRVEIKQFSLGDEPLSVRNVERRTSRRVNDLQYQIGLRYTGGARMLLMLSLNFGVIPIVVPVGVRDFDIDGELWVKLGLIPTEPWIGAVAWAFVSLPRIKFELSPFRLFNLMAIPVLSKFLTKLLTEDLPRLFVRPRKIVLDFQKGKAVGPVANDVESGDVQDKNKDFVGELSVTLVDARDLPYLFFGKTDPYVVLSLGDQVIRSKKNSQTTVIGPPGKPIWNQDFHLLVANPRKQTLYIQVRDFIGVTDFTVGSGEVNLGALEDTVPTDKIVVLQGGWGLFRKGSSGEILLRLTYKAYVEDEEDDTAEAGFIDTDGSDDESSDTDVPNIMYQEGLRDFSKTDKESFMDVLAALIVSEEFQGIVSSEPGVGRVEDSSRAEPLQSRTQGISAETKSLGSAQNSDVTGGSALVWFAAITSILVLIAISMTGSSFFNP